MSYMDAALMASDIFISDMLGAVAVLYPAYGLQRFNTAWPR
jgi:hypothetical protein